MKCYKPALDMLITEQQPCSWPREQLKATLSIMNATHAQEPHEKVKTKHQQCSEQRPLHKQTSASLGPFIQCSESDNRHENNAGVI